MQRKLRRRVDSRNFFTIVTYWRLLLFLRGTVASDGSECTPKGPVEPGFFRQKSGFAAYGAYGQFAESVSPRLLDHVTGATHINIWDSQARAC